MPYPKGKPKSEESKRKASLSCKAKWDAEAKLARSEKYGGEGNPFFGKRHSPEVVEKLRQANIGKSLSDEHRAKVSNSLKGNHRALGNRFELTSEQKERIRVRQSGPSSHWWRGGVTAENLRIRNSAAYRDWRIAVFVRDNRTCVHCGAKSLPGAPVEINADHIKPFSLFPHLRFDVSNGRTLCVPCHKKTDTYGVNTSKAAAKQAVAAQYK